MQKLCLYYLSHSRNVYCTHTNEPTSFPEVMNMLVFVDASGNENMSANVRLPMRW